MPKYSKKRSFRRLKGGSDSALERARQKLALARGLETGNKGDRMTDGDVIQTMGTITSNLIDIKGKINKKEKQIIDEYAKPEGKGWYYDLGPPTLQRRSSIVDAAARANLVESYRKIENILKDVGMTLPHSGAAGEGPKVTRKAIVLASQIIMLEAQKQKLLRDSLNSTQPTAKKRKLSRGSMKKAKKRKQSKETKKRKQSKDTKKRKDGDSV